MERTGAIVAIQSCPDCTNITSGYDFRKGQGKLRDLWQGARCLPLPQVFRRHCVPWQRTVARRRGRNGRVDAMELGGLDVPLAVLVLGA